MVGAPNAGKSTLVNALAGSKVTIVSPKPQTTRFRIRAVVMHAGAQIILVDTPGIFQPRRRLDRAMVAAAWGGAQDADRTLLIVDVRAGLTDAVRAIVERLAKSPKPIWLALNKVDLVEPPRLLPLAAELNAMLAIEETFMISAEKSRGLDRLLEKMAADMPPGPYLFPEDELSDLPNRMLVAEIVREQILRQTHEEVPHHATVETENLAGAQGRQRPRRLHHLCRPRHPEGDPDRRWRRQGEGDRPVGAAGARGAAGAPRAPLPQRQGPPGLGRGARADPGAGPGRPRLRAR